MSLVVAISAVASFGVVAFLTALVYRDAARIGVDLGSPALWAGFVALTGGIAVLTAVIAPDAPLPGVLVVAALGPLLYLLERDDSTGDDPTEPVQLPNAADESETDSAQDADEPSP